MVPFVSGNDLKLNEIISQFSDMKYALMFMDDRYRLTNVVIDNGDYFRAKCREDPKFYQSKAGQSIMRKLLRTILKSDGLFRDSVRVSDNIRNWVQKEFKYLLWYVFQKVLK